jgi:hypothetical protein
MNFTERARILTDRGVPVAPVLANNKRCVLQGWPDRATTELTQIEAWAAAMPDANTAAVCRAEADGIVVLDSDSAELASIVDPMLTTPTFIVRSGGKGFPHYYFRHTDESRALGNAIVMKDGQRLADFQAHRKYVVGPGSRLDTGREYEIISDAPIQPIPPALIEWLRANSIAETPHTAVPKVQGDSILAENFDFAELMAHYKLNGYWKGSWFIVDWCPVSGFPHNGSRHTGFYFDGKTLGFHCFAAGCEGTRMSFGQVLRHLNLSNPAFKGEIWKDDSEKWLAAWPRRNDAAV